MSEGDSTTAWLTNPTIGAAANGLLIGGGAELVGGSTNPPVAPNGFLTESRPDGVTNEWRASGSYSSPSNGGIKAYWIGISRCLGGFGCLESKVRSSASSPGSGYGTASAVTPYPWVTASVGAAGVTNGASSRYLADLIPFAGSNQGFTGRTKDEGSSVSGITTGYSVNLMKLEYGVWMSNSIRFNTAGTGLFRPSGSAPVTLQQDWPSDTAARRWHLESLGGGQYRVRNGNPKQGTQCAFRQSGTSNVKVATCGSGDEFKWTVLGDELVVFQLRNVASGQCIDNNQAAPISGLLLKTCMPGPAQSLFLDAYNWPL